MSQMPWKHLDIITSLITARTDFRPHAQVQNLIKLMTQLYATGIFHILPLRMSLFGHTFIAEVDDRDRVGSGGLLYRSARRHYYTYIITINASNATHL